MSEVKILDYVGWTNRNEVDYDFNMSDISMEFYKINQELLAVNESLSGSEIGMLSYTDQSKQIGEFLDALSNAYFYINEIMYAMPEIDSQFESALRTGEVEELSNLKMDDIHVDNTLGIKMYFYNSETGEYQADEYLGEKRQITLGEFIGYSEFEQDFVKEFADILKSRYEQGTASDPEELEEFLKEFYYMGEYDHLKMDPGMYFLSDVLDVLTIGVKPLLEGILGRNIFGEVLTDKERLFKIVEGVASLVSFSAAVKVGKAAGLGGNALLSAYISESAAGLTAQAISKAGDKLGLPPYVTAGLAMFGGIKAGKIANELTMGVRTSARTVREAMKEGSGSKGGTSTKGYSNFADGMSLEDATRYIKNNEIKFFEEFSERAKASGLNELQISEAFDAMKSGDYTKMASYFDLSSTNNGAVFWSGNKEGAAAYAKDIGGTIMEQTSGGQVFDNWNGLQGMYPEWNTGAAPQKPIWDALSGQYAEGASGSVTYVHILKDGKPYYGTVWNDIEKKILVKNMWDGKVSNILEVIIDGE